MKNIIKKLIKININYSPLLIVLLFLFFLLLQQTVIQIPTAYSETFQTKTEVYPDTPKGVVKAFIETVFSGATNKELNKYFPNNDDIKTIYKTRIIDLSKEWGCASDRTHIVTGYEIKGVRKNSNKASIIVTYKRLGWKWLWPIKIKECRESLSTKNKEKNANAKLHEKGRVWDKERCKFMHITNDIQEVTYNLIKPGKYWRIVDVYELYIPVNIAIEEFNRLKSIDWNNDDPRGPGPSEKQKLEIDEAIKILEKI